MTETSSDLQLSSGGSVRRRLDTAMTVVVFLLSAIGIAANRITPDISYRYWLTMVAVMALAGFVIGGSRVRHHAGRVFFAQILHWLAVAVTAVAALLVLRGTGIGNEALTLMVMLILALGTFIDGIRVSWRLGLLGVVLTATVAVSLYYPSKIWLMPLIAVAVLALSLLLDRRHRYRDLEPEPLPREEAPVETEAEPEARKADAGETESAEAQKADPARSA